MNIDWELFKKQKEFLVTLTDDYSFLPEDIEMLDGVINLMDAIQDEFEPIWCGLIYQMDDEEDQPTGDNS